MRSLVRRLRALERKAGVTRVRELNVNQLRLDVTRRWNHAFGAPTPEVIEAHVEDLEASYDRDVKSGILPELAIRKIEALVEIMSALTAEEIVEALATEAT